MRCERPCRKEKQKEDTYWASQGEGQKSKAQKKRDEAAARKREASDRKAEAKKLALEEDAQMVATKPPKKAAASPKVTRVQLNVQREADAKDRTIQMQKKKLVDSRTVTAEEYDSIVSRPNLNHAEGVVEARGVDQAIAGLSDVGIGEAVAVDPHPEKRLRAAYLAYEERELPRLKEDKPGLTLKQYKDSLWKAFKKSPENPVYAARLAKAKQAG